MKFLDYPEQQKHKGQDFPYFFYHVTHIHPRYNMPYHWHALCEIVHVFSGHFHLQLEDCELLLSPGDSAFISSGITHGGSPLEEHNCCYECLLLDLDRIFQTNSHAQLYEHRLFDLLNQKIIINNFFDSKNPINIIINSMLDLIRFKPSSYPIMLQGYTLILFGELFQQHLYSELSAHHTHKKILHLKNVLSFIDQHYAEDIKLTDLAACANMNENYFCRYFRELTHRTPLDYLNYYRIEAACEQLSYTQKTITEIAYDCGFHDASYFAKVFKHYKNQSPSEYIRADF